MVVCDWLAGVFSKSATRGFRKGRASAAHRRNVQSAKLSTESLESRAMLSRASVVLFLEEVGVGGEIDGTIAAGEEFDVRMHVSESVNDLAVFSGYADVNFDSTHLEALSITHDPDYGSFGATGTIDNVAGLIDELGGSDGFSPPASSLIATIRFRARTAGNSVITTDRGEATISQISSHNPNNSGDLALDATFGKVAVNLPAVPDFSIANAAPASEGTADNSSFQFIVTRTGDVSAAATIAYEVNGFETRRNSDSPATAGDLVNGFAAGTVSFDAGAATAVLSLDVVGDDAIEGNESFAVTLMNPSVDATISDGFATATILDDDTPLEVVSFVPSHGSVGVVFSHPVDRSTLNLYDVQAEVFGPADVTLVGNTVGTVNGSLVVRGNIATFVPTGGVLAADTYTFALRSGADAFRAEVGGVHLDGDKNGTAGGNFTATFTLAAADSLVVEIPDFTRAPGQVVDVPANDTPVGLPISFSDTAGITSIELVVEYDPALLDISDAELGADAPAGATVTANVTDPGYALLTFSNNTALPAGGADLINLTATVPSGATYGAAHVLRVTNLTVNGGAIAATQGAALHVVALFGDTTGDQIYTGLDAQVVSRNVVTLDSGYEFYPLIDPLVVSDIFADAGLTGLDAQRISQKVVDLDPDEIPKRSTRSSKHEAVDVNIPTDLTVVVGTSIRVPVMISDAHDIVVSDINLSYDATLFDASTVSVSAGSVWLRDMDGVPILSGFSVNTEVPGQVLVTIQTTDPLPADVGGGSLLTLNLDLLPAATVGTTTPIDLELGRVSAQDGNLTLNNTPVDGADSTDGLVTVVAAPVFSFDFAPTGTTDFITSLDVNASDVIVLDVYARNADFSINSVSSFSLDIDETTTATELLPLTVFVGATGFAAFPDADITDSLNAVQLLAVPEITPTDTLFLGTITLSAPGAAGAYDLTLGGGSGLNTFPTGPANVPAGFNNLTINVASAAPQLVGIDFGGGAVPTNWTGQSGTSDVTLFNLIDESGAATTFDVAINFDNTLQGGNDAFTPPVGQLPVHGQSLAGLDRAFADQGNVELTFSDLIAGQFYEIYVFAGDEFADNQTVTITAPSSGIQIARFTQPHSANQLLVNDEVGDSARDLSSFAILGAADANGELLIRVDSSGGSFFGLAGVAIREGEAPPPNVIIGDVTIDEVAGIASFPVSLSSPAVDDVTLTLTTVNGAAIAGQDYTAKTAQVTISSGQTVGAATFDVTILDDLVGEFTEAFSVSVQSVDGGTVGDSSDTGIGTIIDGDGAEISVDDVVVDEGAGTLTFTIRANQAPTGDVTVEYATADDTAVAAEDYIAKTGVATILANSTTTTVVVDINDDTVDELSERFFLNLSNPSAGSTISDSQGIGTITANDLSLSVENVTVNEAAGVLAFTILASRAPSVDVTFDFATADDTAIAGSDYTSRTGTERISAGELSTTVSVLISDDTLSEQTEQFFLNLTNASGGSIISVPQGTGTITDNDAAGLTLVIGDASISENGGITTATVSRNTDTASALTVMLSNSNADEALVPLVVTIPVGQTTSAPFNIRGVNELIVDGTQTVTITASATDHVAGTDTVDVTDDDVAGFTITESGGTTSVSETGTTDTFDVVLNSAPLTDVVLTVVSSDTDEAAASPATLTFTSANWNTAQVVTVTGVDDTLVDGTQTTTITVRIDAANSDDAFDALADQTVNVTTIDDDVAGFTITESGGTTSVSETGTTDTFDVVLNSAPLTDVVLTVVSSDTDEAAASPATLTFTPTNWNTAQVVTVTGVDDTLVDGTQTTTITVSIDAANSADAFDTLADQAVSVTTIDDDVAGFTITETGGTTSVSETGTTDTFDVVLNSAPLTDVVLTVVSGDPDEATVSPSTLTFTPTNWNTAQVVIVTGVDDTLVDGTQTTTITVSIEAANSDDAFDALADQTVSVTTIDDDVAGFTITESGGTTSVSETGTTDTFDVVLNSAPLTDVVLTVVSSDTDEAAASPATLTFTSANWNTAQVVTVTGVDDTLVDGTQTTTITVRIDAANSDDAFDALADQTVNVTTIDDDVAGFTITESGGTTSVSETGTTDTFDVVLNSAPLTDVVLTVVSSDTDEAAASPATLTFTPTNWNTAQVVTVTGVDDTLVDGTQTTTITVSIDAANSADAFDALADQAVSVTTIDDDVAGFTITESGGTTSVSETGTTDTFDVVLNSAPLTDVVLTVVSSDTDEAMASPATLTFTPTNWNTAQVVTVTGVDDTLVDGTQTTTITVRIDAANSDDAFDALADQTVGVTTIDDDVVTSKSLLVQIDIDEFNEGVGLVAAIGTVTRTGDTSSSLTVTLASGDTSEATVAGTVTILSGQTSATFDIDAVNDLVFDRTQTVTITASAADYTDATDTVDVTDDETTVVGIQFDRHGSEAGLGMPSSGTFILTLSTPAEFDITVPVVKSGTATAGIDFADFTTVTISAGQTTTPYSVMVLDDEIAELPDQLRVQLSPNMPGVSVDPTAAASSMLLLDDDIVAINVSHASVVVGEPGTQQSFDVTLASEPIGPVTVELLITDPSEVSTDITQLIFTPANWNIPQSVMVEAMDDLQQDGSQVSAIILFVDPIGAPGLFQNMPATEVKVTTLDDEAPVPPNKLDSVTFYNKDADRERDLSLERNGQRSLVNHIEVVLDGSVSVATGAVTDGSFAVQNTDDGSIVGLTADSVTEANGKTTVVLSFTSGTEASGSLVDGNYQLTISEVPLGVDANDDGAIGEFRQIDFHRLFGDSDGDKDVDGRDIGNFRKAMFARPTRPSVYSSVFDFDDDKQILGDLDDLFELQSRLGTGIER